MSRVRVPNMGIPPNTSSHFFLHLVEPTTYCIGTRGVHVCALFGSMKHFISLIYLFVYVLGCLGLSLSNLGRSDGSLAGRWTQNDDRLRHDAAHVSRRTWMQSVLAGTVISSSSTLPAFASEDYENPNMPPGPVERSGLVVLRVAEVASYQEKLIRAILNKQIDVVVSPQQIVFGTQILLRNSEIAGNMKLMIDTEVDPKLRGQARQRAANSMNILQGISSTAAKVERPFTEIELLAIADMYRDLRLQLNAMYECLPPKGKEKYYGYFMQVTEYERKIAEGTYNPELDGVLRFDD